MKKLRVMVVMDEDLVPPDTLDGVSEEQMLEWKSEFDVVATLREIGHTVVKLGVSRDLTPIRNAIEEHRPHIAFNLLEEFHGVATYDQHVVGYLELMRQAYTGCNPRGLMLAHDKALCKKLLTYHRIPTPKFHVLPRGRVARVPKRLQYPLLVKSVIEEASLGITKDSIVRSPESLQKRAVFIHEELRTDALVEEFVEGREFYVGVLGNRRLQTFPIWELIFKNLPEDVPNIATARVKWDLAYQKKLGIETEAAKDLEPSVVRRILQICKRVYRVLQLSGYARVDLRMTEDGRVYVLEANPNPNLSYGEDFSESAETIGISYEQLIQRILSLGLAYQPEWRVWAVSEKPPG